jgi:hypothetical protein
MTAVRMMLKDTRIPCYHRSFHSEQPCSDCLDTPHLLHPWLTWRSGRTEPTSLATAGACRCTRFFEVVEFRELRGLLAFLGRDTVTVTALSAAGAMLTVFELARPASGEGHGGQVTIPVHAAAVC